MNDQWDEQHAALKTEIHELQRKLAALASQNAQVRGGSSVWRRPSNAALWLSVAIASLLLPGGVIYGQKAMEALFIDRNGNVGVGTVDPKATLDVNGTAKVTQVRISSDSTNKDDGALVAKAFAPGLNVVGINTDKTYRKLAVWGQVSQMENGGTNSWQGKTQFSGDVGASGGFKATPVELKGQGTPLPFWFDVEKGGNKSFSLDDYCADRDGCRVRFVCNKYVSENSKPNANDSPPDEKLLLIRDVVFFRLAFFGSVYIYAMGAGQNRIGHDIKFEHWELLRYSTAWYQQSVALNVMTGHGQCKVTVYDY
jgi:hypothetical protein